VEAAMKLGETLKLDDITAQAAAEGPEGK